MGFFRKSGYHCRVACEEVSAYLDDGEEQIRDSDCRSNDTKGLAEQQFLAAQRGREQRFERSLLAFPDHGVRGNDSGQECRRNQQHEKRTADGDIYFVCGNRRGEAKDGDERFDEEDQRRQSHGHEDEWAAPVFTELLVQHRTEPPEAELHRGDASGSSLTSCRYTSSREWRDSLMETTSAPAATSARVTRGAMVLGS